MSGWKNFPDELPEIGKFVIVYDTAKLSGANIYQARLVQKSDVTGRMFFEWEALTQETTSIKFWMNTPA